MRRALGRARRTALAPLARPPPPRAARRAEPPRRRRRAAAERRVHARRGVVEGRVPPAREEAAGVLCACVGRKRIPPQVPTRSDRRAPPPPPLFFRRRLGSLRARNPNQLPRSRPRRVLTTHACRALGAGPVHAVHAAPPRHLRQGASRARRAAPRAASGRILLLRNERPRCDRPPHPTSTPSFAEGRAAGVDVFVTVAHRPDCCVRRARDARIARLLPPGASATLGAPVVELRVLVQARCRAVLYFYNLLFSWYGFPPPHQAACARAGVCRVVLFLLFSSWYGFLFSP